MQERLPSRRGDKTDRAWLLFCLLSGLLVWVASGGHGLVNAQEPAKTDAAAKDAPPAKEEKADAPPAEPEGAAKSASAPAAANGTDTDLKSVV